MAFSSTVQPASAPVSQPKSDGVAAASLLSMLVLSVYAAGRSKRAMRKLQRRFLWTAFKLKMKSLFSTKRAASDRTLLLILLGVLVLALLIVNVVIGLIVLLTLLILYLLGVLNI